MEKFCEAAWRRAMAMAFSAGSMPITVGASAGESFRHEATATAEIENVTAAPIRYPVKILEAGGNQILHAPQPALRSIPPVIRISVVDREGRSASGAASGRDVGSQ